MGFYGNINNTVKVQFSFDRIFSSRFAMDDSVANGTDAVFAGRFVLISYDDEVHNFPIYFLKDNKLYTNKYDAIHGINEKTVSIGSIVHIPINHNFDDTTTFGYYRISSSGPILVADDGIDAYHAATDYYKKDNRLFVSSTNAETDAAEAAEAEEKYPHAVRNIASGTIIHIPKDFNLDDPTNENIGYYRVESVDDSFGSNGGYAVLTQLIHDDATSEKSTYLLNYLLDTNTYGAGRGYDGTVWQKMYADGEPYFAMVAELNSIVPTLAITADAPTIVPKAPHFDVDTSNVYYKLHLQSAPGLWLKPAIYNSAITAGTDVARTINEITEEIEVTKEELNYPSDLKYAYPLIRPDGSQHYASYNAAVYFNKAGFDPINITYAADAEEGDEGQQKNIWNFTGGKYIPQDFITMDLSGKSGQLYAEDGSINKTVQPDTNELAIMLPSIGDTMAQVWDLIYGGRAALGGEHATQRNLNISWEDAGEPQFRAGLRLTKETGSGIGYAQDEVNTVAGSINTMHDLIGMIIVNAAEDGIIEGDTAPAADVDRIYWDDEHYYRIDIEYDAQYDSSDPTNNLNPLPHFVETDLEDPKPHAYFDKYGSNYLLIRNASDFKKNKKYYYWPTSTPLKDAFEVANVPELGYEKSKYYYIENGNYILDKNDTPTSGRQYYKIEEGGWQSVANGASVIWFAPNRFYIINDQGEVSLNNEASWDETPGTGHYTLYLIQDKTSTGDAVYVDVTDRVRNFVSGKYYTYNAETSTYSVVTEDAYTDIWPDDSDNNYDPQAERPAHKMTDIDSISLHLYTLSGTEQTSLYAPGTYYYVAKPIETNDPYNYLEIMDENNENQTIHVIGDIVKDKSYKKEPGRTYFSKKDEPVQTAKSFYISGQYYLRDDVNGDVESDETPSHMYSLTNEVFNSNHDYYERFNKHVLSDDFNIFPAFSEWNPNIEVPYDETAEEGQRGVQLCWLKDKQVYRELEGYARDKNTLNGLLLETHKLFGAEDTRDLNTVHGAINSIHDLTNNFATMKAGETVVIDEYGRMHSGQIVGDDWINIDLDADKDEPGIIITHLKKDVVNTTAVADTNLSTSTTASVSLQDLAFDAMGHVNANQSHTYNLPYNFGEIQIDSDTTNIISPDNTYDKLTLTGDSWVQLTPNATNDTIAFTHIGPVTVAHQDKTDVSPAFGGSFEIEDWTFDTKGHKTSGGTHTITLPIGSYANTPATTDATGVITGLGFTGSTGAITSTSNYLGAIQLGSYTAPSGGNGISTTSTLSDALATLDARIAAEETNRNNIITALDYTDTAVTDEVVTAVNQVDGLISVTRAAVFSNLSEGSATPQLVTYNTKGLITGGSDLTWNTIKDFTVGTDANNAPVTLDDLAQYLLRIHGGALAKTLNSITVTPPTKTTYEDGEMLDLTGMTITGNYIKAGISSSELINSNDYTVSPSGGSTLSAANSPITVTVTYQGKSDTFEVIVNPVPIMTGIEITQEPTTTSYTDGDHLNLTGLQVTAHFSNANSRILNTSEYVTDPVEGATLTFGDIDVVVSVPNTEFTDSFAVHIDPQFG